MSSRKKYSLDEINSILRSSYLYPESFVPFKEDTTFYRWQHPKYVYGTDPNHFFVKGYFYGAASVDDVYNEPVRTDVRCKYLDDPGLGVTDNPDDTFNSWGPLQIEISLNDVLSVGGKVYNYCAAYNDCWYVTIPELIPANIWIGDVNLYRLGGAYNRVIGDENYFQSVQDWMHDDGLCLAFVQERKPSGLFNHELRYLTLGKKLIVKEFQSSEDVKFLNANILCILMKHPDLKEIHLPKGISDTLSRYLDDFGLEKYNVCSFQ